MVSYPIEMGMRKQKGQAYEKKKTALYTPAINVPLPALWSLSSMSALRLYIFTAIQSFQSLPIHFLI